MIVVASPLPFFPAVRDPKPGAEIVTDGPTRGDEFADYRSISRVADFVTAWANR